MRSEINKALRSLPYYLFLAPAVLILAFVLFQPTGLAFISTWEHIGSLVEICFFVWCLRQIVRVLWFIFRENRRMI